PPPPAPAAGPAPGPGSRAALDGGLHAAPRNAAHVGRAGIGIVAVRRRGAAGTARRGLAAAHTGIARVGRARIAVVAVGVGLAGQAVSNWLVRADMARGGTGFGSARVVVARARGRGGARAGGA